MNKLTVKLVCLFLGLLSLTICPASEADLEIKIDPRKQFEVVLDNNSLSFPLVATGKMSEERSITTLVKGNDFYQLYVQATVLKADGLKELSPAVLEFREKSESRWLPASDTLIPVLATPAMANVMGDQKEITFRLNVPNSAKAGLYSCEVTIIARGREDLNKSMTEGVYKSTSEDVIEDANKSTNVDVNKSVTEDVYS